MKQAVKLLLCVVAAATLFVGCAGNNESSSSPAASPPEASPLPAEPDSQPNPADVSVQDVLNAIREAYGDQYPANGEIPAEMLEAEFGLHSDLYVEARGEMAMISANNDRIVVAKAAPGKADELEKALEDARERKIADTLQYPANVPKTDASRVVRHGDYVAFLLVGGPLDNPNATEQAIRDHAEAEAQRAVDAFNGIFEA